MANYLVLATPRSFAKNDDAPIRLLEENGCEVVRLPKDGGDLTAQLAEYLPQADAVIAGLEPYDRALLSTAKKLKVISRYGVGYDKVDLDAARELLRNSAMSLKEIAAALHFSDEYYFACMFKRRTGIAPGRYRNARRKEC